MTNSSYTNAIVSERARFQQEFDTISRRDRTTGAPSFGSFLDREQAQESARKRHAEACAAIIAQAYHDGDYDAFWRTLSKAARFDRNIGRNTINSIARNTITLAGLRDRPINEAAIRGEWFTRAVHQDTSEETTSLSAGVYLLFDHLDDASNIITLSASAGKTSFMVAHNTVTLGVRVVEELTNSGIARHELLPRINRYTGELHDLFVSAYLAGESNHGHVSLARAGGELFRRSVASTPSLCAANYALVHVLCGSVHEATARWRTMIVNAEKYKNRTNEIAARCGHMKLCGALMKQGSLPADDLSVLIDTFQATRLMRVPTQYGKMKRGTFINERDEDGDLTTANINNVEELIDYAAGRMEAQ